MLRCSESGVNRVLANLCVSEGFGFWRHLNRTATLASECRISFRVVALGSSWWRSGSVRVLTVVSPAFVSLSGSSCPLGSLSCVLSWLGSCVSDLMISVSAEFYTDLASQRGGYHRRENCGDQN